MKTIITKRKSGSRRVQLELDVESKVEQHHEGSSDINAIIRKAEKVGRLPDPVLPGVYGDFSSAEDYHETQNRVIAAGDMFDALPADLRMEFGNDAGVMLEFVNNPDNVEEARKMGLVPPEEREPDVAAEAPKEPVAAPKEPKKPPEVPKAPAKPAE